MPLRIISAKVIKDIVNPENIAETVDLDTLTKEIYNQKYRNQLYCPTAGCTAPILFAEGPKLKYFKNVNQPQGETQNFHIPECAHYVEYDLNGKPHSKNTLMRAQPVTIDHIKNTLRHIYKKEHPDEYPVINISNKKKSSSKRVQPNTDTPKDVASGVDKNGLSPENTIRKTSLHIPNKSINEISSADYSTATLPLLEGVFGYLSSDIIFHNDTAYIDLLRKDNKKARIFFSEEFNENSPSHALQTYKNYINQTSEPIYFVCVGTIKQLDEYDFNIYPDSSDCLTLDNNSLGQLVNKLQK